MVDSLGTVVTPSLNFSGLNYDGFVAILMRAVQQLDSRTNQLDSVLKALSNCCEKNSDKLPRSGMPAVGKTELEVELSDNQMVFLSQNSPNPFAESCIIDYNLPDDFKVAQIIFQTSEGRILKVVDLIEKGKGRLNVFASDLSNGMYSYYLTIDGRIIDTKKLVKQN